MIAGAIIVFGSFHIRWVVRRRSTVAVGVAASRGLSPFRIAPPYNRWGVDARCEIWTLWGVFFGGVLGLGLGWGLLGSLPLGILLAGAGALIAGWHYRVVASLLAVDRDAHEGVERPHPAQRPELADQPPEAGRGVRDGRVNLVLAAAVCAVAVAVVGLWRGDVHGPIAVVGFAAIVLFVAWRVMRITDGQRAT